MPKDIAFLYNCSAKKTTRLHFKEIYENLTQAQKILKIVFTYIVDGYMRDQLKIIVHPGVV